MVRLGRSGLTVSRLCLGTMNFGRVMDEAAAHLLLDAALEAGITFIDTANTYGWTERLGRSEEIIGSWLAGSDSRRERIVLATKVYGAMSDQPNDRGLSARNIVRSCEGSLRRLQTDYLDLYQMHHVDRSVPWEETLSALERLVAEGKVLYTGSSNFAGWDIARANERASVRHGLGLVSEQSLYNLCERTVELEVLPVCREYGVALLPWSPLHGGVLSGVLSRSDRARSVEGRPQKYAAAHGDQLTAFERLCAEMARSPAEIALAWLLHQDGVTAPVVGPRTPDQLAGCLRAMDVELSTDTQARLDAVFPGPGGPAPEAYAW